MRAAIDGLRPGVTLSLSFGASSAGDPILLSGHTISCSYGRGSISAPSRWLLPSIELFPTVRYSLGLDGSVVKVTSVG